MVIPLIIGVVGKMASGKSTVCDYLKTLFEDAEIIDVDIVAKGIYSENPEVIGDLKHFFGETICFPDGELDYNTLALKIFSSQKNLKKINSIMFPKIKARIEVVLEEKSKRDCLIIDAAVLFDAKLSEFCDYIIWVKAEKTRRFKQLRSICNLSDEDIITRIDGQVINIMKEKVDYIINNSGTLAELKVSVKNIADKIKADGSVK